MPDQTTVTDQEKASKDFEAAVNTVNAANQTSGTQPQSDDTAASGSNQSVKIGDDEYTSDQLAELVKKGKIAKEWESLRPGYNLDSFMADYTQKSQRLADLERAAEFQSKTEETLSGDDQAILKKAVEPIVESRLQVERDAQAVKLFQDKYQMDNDKWRKFVAFYDGNFNRPKEVDKQLSSFELALKTFDFDGAVQQKLQQEKGKTLAEMQRLEMASAGGGGKNIQPAAHEYTPEQIRYMEQLGVLDYAKKTGYL